MSLSVAAQSGKLARRAPPVEHDKAWRFATFAPAFLMMLVLSILPIANLFWTSLNHVAWMEGQPVWTFVGLDNYMALGGDALVRAGLINTFIFAAGAVSGQMLLGFFLAYLTTRITRARTLYRAIFILPVLIPGIVIGAIWKLMLSADFGLVNHIISVFAGYFTHDWLGSSETALLSVIIVDIWHWTPFCFLLFLAGLESLPQEVFEASKVDGGSAWQELRYITIPLMLPTIVVTFAFRFVLAFKVFDEIYLLTGGGPGTSSEVISFTLYQRFFVEDRIGYGSAMSVFIIFVVCLMLAMVLTVQRRAGSAR